MPSPEEAYERLFKKVLSDEERLRMMEVQRALGLQPTDSLWSLFVVLGYYVRLYEKLLEEIKTSCQEILEKFRKTSEETARAAQLKALEGLHEAVKELLPAVVSEFEGRLKWKYIWRTACMAVFGSIAGATLLLVWQNAVLKEHLTYAALGKGQDVALAGSQSGRYARELDEAGLLDADALDKLTWIDSRDGKAMYRMAQEGRPLRQWLESLDRCADDNQRLTCVSSE